MSWIGLRVKIDKMKIRREVRRKIGDNRAAVVVRKWYKSIFPITEADITELCRVLEVTRHSWRRTAALRARKVAERGGMVEAKRIEREALQRQGWAETSQQFWEYSVDHLHHEYLMESAFIDGW